MSAMDIVCCDRCSILFKLTFSMIGTLSGLSIFIVFLFQYHNYNAALWGSVTGIFSFCVFHLNYLYLKNKIDEWYNPEALENIKLLSLVFLLVSLVGFGIYISLFITRAQSMFEMNQYSYFPAAIFSALSVKSGLMLYTTANHYKKYVIMCNPQFIYDIRAKQPDSDQELPK